MTMLYFWLIPLILAALVLLAALLVRTRRRRQTSPSGQDGQTPEAIKRSKYINK